jgi:eukaryotic-like serine/threonine-protein kinase
VDHEPERNASPLTEAWAQGPSAAKGGRRRKRLVIAVAVVVVVAALAAGGWLVARPYLLAARGGAAPGAPGAPGGWVNPIGDVRTADPCAVTDYAAMQQFGATRLYPDLDLPTSCAVLIRPNATEAAFVDAELSEPLLSDHDLASMPSQRVGQMTIYQGKGSPRFCARAVLLPDRFRVVLRASVGSMRSGTNSGTDSGGTGGGDTSSLDLCAVADAGVQVALRALNTPSLPRRALAGPPNSLLWLDALRQRPPHRVDPGRAVRRGHQGRRGRRRQTPATQLDNP